MLCCRLKSTQHQLSTTSVIYTCFPRFQSLKCLHSVAVTFLLVTLRIERIWTDSLFATLRTYKHDMRIYGSVPTIAEMGARSGGGGGQKRVLVPKR